MTSVSRGRLEDRAAPLQPILQRQRIGQVAVVGDGEAAAGKLGEQRLDVALDRPAVGRVALMADGPVAGEAVDDRALGEIVADQADMALADGTGAVVGRRCRRLPGRDAAGRADRARSAPRRPGGRRRRRRRIPREACRRRVEGMGGQSRRHCRRSWSRSLFTGRPATGAVVLDQAGRWPLLRRSPMRHRPALPAGVGRVGRRAPAGLVDPRHRRPAPRRRLQDCSPRRPPAAPPSAARRDRRERLASCALATQPGGAAPAS